MLGILWKTDITLKGRTLLGIILTGIIYVLALHILSPFKVDTKCSDKEWAIDKLTILRADSDETIAWIRYNTSRYLIIYNVLVLCIFVQFIVHRKCFGKECTIDMPSTLRGGVVLGKYVLTSI